MRSDKLVAVFVVRKMCTYEVTNLSDFCKMAIAVTKRTGCVSSLIKQIITIDHINLFYKGYN